MLACLAVKVMIGISLADATGSSKLAFHSYLLETESPSHKEQKSWHTEHLESDPAMKRKTRTQFKKKSEYTRFAARILCIQ